MDKDLYYEIEENGYWIKDRNDSKFRIHQYEPYIPDPSKSYEENAQAQIAEIMAAAACTNDYGVPDATLQQIQDDTVADLIELGVL